MYYLAYVLLSKTIWHVSHNVCSEGNGAKIGLKTKVSLIKEKWMLNFLKAMTRSYKKRSWTKTKRLADRSRE